MDDVDEEPSPFREPVCDDEDVETGTRRGRKGEMWLWSCGGESFRAYGKETVVVWIPSVCRNAAREVRKPTNPTT
jgi:hypothetical protein